MHLRRGARRLLLTFFSGGIVMVGNHRWIRWQDLPEFLTVEELREYLRIGRSTAYELVRSGGIKCVRVGRRVLIPRAAVPRGDTLDQTSTT